jgi:hypothetical protein
MRLPDRPLGRCGATVSEGGGDGGGLLKTGDCPSRRTTIEKRAPLRALLTPQIATRSPDVWVQGAHDHEQQVSYAGR